MPHINLGILRDIDALQRLHSWRGRQVLDVGCGSGQLSRALAGIGAIVRGFEPDPIQAEKNSRAPATAGVRFASAPAEALPVADASVDVVILSRSLHHVPVALMDGAIAEAHRVLRPGGALIVLEPDIHGQFSQLIRPFHDETVVRAEAIAALDRAAARFSSSEERWYTTESRFGSFSEFKAAMIGKSFNDIVPERIEQAEVAAAFEAGRTEQGYRFTNPIRARILAKAEVTGSP